MGVYYGKRENRCPRCKDGIVLTTFISVTPMTFSQYCSKCKADDFSKEDEEYLGDNKLLGDYTYGKLQEEET